MDETRTKPGILLVEDDIGLQKSLAFILEKEGFHVAAVRSGEEAICLARKEKPDLILLDLVLPGIDGYKVCGALKKDPQTAGIFIILLSGKKMLEDIVTGLKEYADDYITKPFEPQILLARVRAILRRKMRWADADRTRLEFNGLTIDLGAYEVQARGEKIRLTKTEFDILALLAQKPNQVFTRARILDHVREDGYPITERTVDYQVSGLRKKLGPARARVETVRGVGYKFALDEDPDSSAGRR
jgi:two-component system alkaline phosphatase synthesis response regulator PhoP